MKNFTYLILFTILFTSNTFALKNSSLKMANYYLKEKGEVVSTFKANSKQQFTEINKFLSIGNKNVDSQLLVAEAFTNKDLLQKFLTFGSSSSQTFTIQQNCTAPVPNVTTLPNATGQCSVTVTAPTATSDCVGQITGTTTSPLTYTTQGTYTITWTYNDGNGNSTTQNQTVIVNDTTDPVPNVTTLPTINQQCAATVTAPLATDNCSGLITGTTASPLSYNSQGTYVITWTYTDTKGNSSYQNQIISIEDTIAPVPNVTSLPIITGQCSATVTPPTAIDNCSGTIIGSTASPLTYNKQGTYTIVWTFHDGNGNSSTQTQTVIVNDTIAPVPFVSSLPTINSQCGTTLIRPIAIDNCSGIITGSTTSSLTFTSQGTFTITWTYTDAKGNSSSQNQTVIIDDTVAPVPNTNSLPILTNQCFVIVTQPTATDACSGQINGTTTSPLLYQTQGTFTIVWTYDDGNGNTSTQNQTVIVNDTIAPVANVTSLPTINAQCSATITAPTATDNCSGQITATTSNPLTYNTFGTYVITWTYTDAKGNTSTQNQTVIVGDTVAPVANVTSLPTLTGLCTVIVTAPTATDTCAGQITGTTSDPLTYTTSGTFTITWTYDDGNGNTSTQTQTVIVTNGGVLTTYYQDADGDGFGNPLVSVETCPAPNGYVSDATDCDDTQIQYADNDEDGFGSTTQVACGVTNNSDCNDNQIQYIDADGDSFGWFTQVACGVTNNSDCDDTDAQILAPTTFFQDADGDGFGTDLFILTECSQPTGYVTNDSDCDDNQILYADLDGDGFGSTTQSGCGVTNDTDCDDNNPLVNESFTFFQDADGDGFGTDFFIIVACTQPEGYTTNDSDCDDSQILYTDDDQDGYGSSIQSGCGVTNNIDCDDTNAQIFGLLTYYQDNDFDSYGNPAVSFMSCTQPEGFVSNNLDCNDTRIDFEDLDGDGFGTSNQVACGVANNLDCNDNDALINGPVTYYQDGDSDGFGLASSTLTTCFQPFGYVLDNTDCNDDQIQYIDADGDGFGFYTQVACGVSNNLDCDDTNNEILAPVTYYQDADEDGFGTSLFTLTECSQPTGYVTNDDDCDDFQILYADLDGDGFGSTTQLACGGVTNDTDCNDDQIQYQDNDGDGFGSAIIVACGVTNSLDLDDNNPNSNTLTTYYQDLDGDGFGNPAVSVTIVTQPVGYVINNTDCNDNQIQYGDLDADGFGSTTQVACGVTNNTDCNDNQIQYADADDDGFGSTTQVACGGVTNNTDCNDNQIQYQDNDGDGFGATTQVACGVTNNSDCNDNQIQYADADGDGFGATTQVACGVTNNTDCNDNQIQYADIDGDGFGATTQVACGVTNNSDCNDNQIQYFDNDGDGFGSTTQVACGVSNNTDCNDNQIQYADIDGDGFGSTTQVACGVINNSDCNDNQIQYFDNDGDGFGSTTQVACGVPNNTDCNDNQIQYADIDGDGFGSTTPVACGVINNSDCNDNQIQYFDNDGDGFGSTTQVACGVSNNTDCNDNLILYADLDGDSFGSTTFAACGVTNSTDCNDNQLQYFDNDGDGFGSTTRVACGVANNIDCNDFDILILGPKTYYQDLDGDSYGNPAVSQASCDPIAGYVLIGTDCDDTRANVNPAAIDVCYDALDNDCNGIIDNVGQPGGCIPIVTTLGSATCGATINNLSVTIVASYIVGAQGYRFKVTNTVTNTVQIVDRPVNSFALTSLSGITYNTQYQIEVALKVFNVWQPFYGAPCYVVTPTPNSTIGAQCGTTLTSLSQWIYATSFANITSYRFRVTNLTTNQVQILDRSLNKFMMTNLTNITNNTVYRVEISLRNTNGVYLPYGTPCTISTPNVTTRITPDPISTITTTESPKEKLNSVVYPNPFSNNFNLTIENGTTENVKITIYDLTGRLIDTKTVNYSEIENLELGNDYPSGVYNLILTQGTETKSLRIVKR